jgi:hypothetical protein
MEEEILQKNVSQLGIAQYIKMAYVSVVKINKKSNA